MIPQGVADEARVACVRPEDDEGEAQELLGFIAARSPVRIIQLVDGLGGDVDLLHHIDVCKRNSFHPFGHVDL